MSAKLHGAQKFIGRNRPPRVQIECDEEIYGAQVKVSLPFVAGVLANLTGNWLESGEELAAKLTEAKDKNDAKEISRLTDAIRARGELAAREFLEIDQDNFNDVLALTEPTAQFTVPNTLTGEGNRGVSLKFRNMTDFDPDRIAEQLDFLKPLLEARQALNYLKNMATNKTGLQKLIQRLIEKPELAQAILAAAKQEKKEKTA